MDASRRQATEVLERPAVDGRVPTSRPSTARGIDWRPALATLFGAYTALALAFSAAGVALVHLGPLEGLRDWDLSVSEWFEAHRTATWDSVMTFGSRLGETEAVVAVAIIAVAVLFRLHHRWAAAVIAFGLALEVATFITANNLVRRERPPVSTVGDAPTTFSFPSGHVAATVVLWGGLALVVVALPAATPCGRSSGWPPPCSWSRSHPPGCTGACTSSPTWWRASCSGCSPL